MKVTMFTGKTLEFEEPAAGFGWSMGKIDDAEVVDVYIRESEHGGGVFVRAGGDIIHAETGENTVQFNNRIWTTSEEAAEIERIKLDGQD
jgi:hypothetical protein